MPHARPLPFHHPATIALALIWGAVVVGAAMLAAQWSLWWLAGGGAPLPGIALRRAPAALPPHDATAPVRLPPGVVMLDPGGGAARPFSLARVGSLDRARATECLTAAIYYEASGESDDGQRAVAQVVLNRVRHAAFPATVCGVVYQGSQNAVCQFSFACDGADARAPSREGWARAARAAAAALDGLVYAPVGLATHYHTFAVTPSWNRALVMTAAVGAHFFHRWKGADGTPAAFARVYRGHEPEPGPHRAPFAPLAAIPLPVIAAPPPASDARLPESTILDRWKDSGTPLR